MPSEAVFLDRDGVINADRGYVGVLDDFTFLPGVKEALALMRARGYLLILCTNQSGIARGRYLMSDFERTTAWMQQDLALHGAAFDAVYACPHHPQAQVEAYRCRCRCRKPLPGMFERAIAGFALDPRECAAAGDRARDLEGAAACGVRTLALVGAQPGEAEKAPQACVFPDLLSFAKTL